MQTQNAHLAIASVPVQSWGELYDQDAALKTGTIFKDLDLPFFAADQIPGALSSLEDSLKSPEEIRWRDKMLEVQKVSFMMDDLRLYLDTHPCCEKALAYYREQAEKRKRLMKEYAECYGPLTIDDALASDGNTWKWMEQPFPWEREGGCR